MTVPCTDTNHKPQNGYTPLTMHQAPVVAPAQFPEAQCSVNLRFRIEGYADPAQATGRGTTPDEAALRLRETIDATRAALAPETRLPSRDELMHRLIGQAVCKAATAGDLNAITRLGKAVQLVQSGAVEPGEREGTWAVRSGTDPLTWYTVEERTCTCPDYTRHAQQGDGISHHCKHVLAVALTIKLRAAAPF